MLRVVMHQMRTDLRAQRWTVLGRTLLLLLNGILSLSGVASLTAVDGPSRLFALAVVSVAAQYLLGMLIAVRWVHADPAATSTAFWVSRPIARRVMLAAKLTEILLILLLPAIVVHCAALLASGMSVGQLPQAALDIAFREALVVLPVTAAASLTRDVVRVTLIGAASLFGPFVLQTTISRMLFDLEASGASRGWPMPGGSIVLVVLATGLVWTIAVLAHQYETRRTLRSVALSAGGLLVLFLLAALWRIPVVTAREVPLAPSVDVDRVTVEVTAVRGPEEHPHREVAGTAWAKIDVSGLPNGYVVRHTGTRGSLVFRDGLPAEDTDPTESAVFYGAFNREWLAECGRLLKVEWKQRREEVDYESRLLRIRDWRLIYQGSERAILRWQQEGARYEGDLRFHAFRLSAAATLPLAGGATGVVDGRRVTVLSASRGERDCVVRLLVSEPRLIRNPQRDTFTMLYSSTPLRVVLRHRRLGQGIANLSRVRYVSRPTSGWYQPVYVSSTPVELYFDLGGPEDGTTPEVAADWMKNGELVLVSEEPAGQFSKKVSLPLSKLGE